MTQRIRRTPQQWQQLIERQSTSGEAARQFCSNSNLNYGLFCKWRKRLAANTTEPFLDVSSLVTPGGPVWDVELELGNGMTLRLRRA